MYFYFGAFSIVGMFSLIRDMSWLNRFFRCLLTFLIFCQFWKKQRCGVRHWNQLTLLFEWQKKQVFWKVYGHNFLYRLIFEIMNYSLTIWSLFCTSSTNMNKICLFSNLNSEANNFNGGNPQYSILKIKREIKTLKKTKTISHQTRPKLAAERIISCRMTRSWTLCATK